MKAAHGLLCVRPAGVGARHVPAALTAHALVAARAECIRSLAGQDHDADACILARACECIRELDHGLRPKGITDLGAVDRDLCDPGVLSGPGLVADVGVLAGRLPGDGHRAGETTVSSVDHWVVRAAAVGGERVAVAGLSYAQLLASARAAAGALVEQGVRPGGRVALALAPGPEFVAVLPGGRDRGAD